MAIESQQPDRLVFKRGGVFVVSNGQRKPIEGIIGENNPGNIFPIQTFRAAAADYADLVNE